MQKEKGWKKNIKKRSSLILPFYLSFFILLDHGLTRMITD